MNTTGDGFFATFDGPARAVRCAQAILDEARSLGVEVRAGVHVGECEMRGDHPDVVVLSRGRELRLKTGPETLSLLDAHGIEIRHEETSAAIDEYNLLAASGRRVAALIHTTC